MIGTVILSAFASAQSVEDGKKFMYYERWQSAAKIFDDIIQREPVNMEARYWKIQLLLEQDKPAEALIDTTMEPGLAVPYYQKVIEIASAEPEKNKTILIQAYGYAGAL